MSFFKPKKGGDKKTGLSLGKRLGLLFCLFILTIALAPQGFVKKVYATCASLLPLCGTVIPCPVTNVGEVASVTEQTVKSHANFLQSFEKYESIIEWWAMVGDVMKMNWDKQEKAEKEDAAIQGAMDQGYMKGLAKIGDSHNDTAWNNVQLGASMKATSEAKPPAPSEQYLCNNMYACQGEGVMQEFSRMVSKMVGEGLLAWARGSSTDGLGPWFSKQVIDSRCGGGPGELKYGSPLDGWPSDCLGGGDLPRSSAADSDTDFSVLSRDSVLQVPGFKKTQIDTSSGAVDAVVPDIESGSPNGRDINEKRAFVAAVYYCHRISGPRPSSPDLSKISDKNQANLKLSAWQHCVEMQETLIKQCSDRIGKISRPDCANDDYKSLCSAALQSCGAAREAHVEMPPSFRECDAGANLYQFKHLCISMCSAFKRFQAGAAAGESDADMTAKLPICAILEEELEKELQREDDTLREAVSSLGDELSKCWKRVDAM